MRLADKHRTAVRALLALLLISGFLVLAFFGGLWSWLTNNKAPLDILAVIVQIAIAVTAALYAWETRKLRHESTLHAEQERLSSERELYLAKKKYLADIDPEVIVTGLTQEPVAPYPDFHLFLTCAKPSFAAYHVMVLGHINSTTEVFSIDREPLSGNGNISLCRLPKDDAAISFFSERALQYYHFERELRKDIITHDSGIILIFYADREGNEHCTTAKISLFEENGEEHYECVSECPVLLDQERAENYLNPPVRLRSSMSVTVSAKVGA